MEITIEVGLILVVSGILVGFINTLAGGATVVSITVFMLLGLPVTVANGTNRLPVILQNLTSSFNFRRQKRLDVSLGLKLSVPMIVGSLIGAEIASTVEEMVFKICLGVVLFVVLVVMVISPSTALRGRGEPSAIKPVDYFWFLLIGFYSGYIYVGLGYILLGVMLARFKYDIVKANAIKGFITLVTTPFSFMIFVLNDQVDYTFGLLHAVGNIAGAYVASHYASRFGVIFLKWFLVAIIVVTMFDMFGLISLKNMVGDFI